jgi:CshA-type fibril repeat protein
MATPTEIPPGTIAGAVYHDRNGNGYFDTGEPGLSGVTITLSNGFTTTTDVDGGYSFTNLAPGVYTIIESNPSGYSSTGDAEGANDDTIGAITVTSGSSSTGNDFFDAQPGTITGTVYNDLNGNGSYDAGEPGLSGVRLELSNGMTTTTAANGIYTFTVLPRVYTITETNPSGYTSNGDTAGANDDHIPDVVLSSGNNSNGHDFFDSIHALDVTATPRCIFGVPHLEYAVTPSGFIPGANPLTMRWRALDDNTLLYEYTGLALSGTLLWPEAQVDGNGRGIAWPGWQLVDGEYLYVGSDLRPDVAIELSVNPTQVITVSYPKATPSCAAEPPASIGDQVWVDSDQDGRQDAGEPGLANVTVKLLDSSQSVITQTVTDSSGAYTFTLPLTGTYYLRVTPPFNYRLSPQNQGDDAGDSDADSNGLIGPLTIVTAMTDRSVDIGLYPIGPVATPDDGRGRVGQPITVTVVANDTPSGYPLDPTTIVIVNPPAGSTLTDDGKTLTVPGEGIWTVTPGGTMVFTPIPGFTDSPTPIQYMVADTNGTPSNPATVTITVIGLALTPDSAAVTLPGTVVTYTHVLTNTGSATDSYTISAVSNRGYPLALSTTAVTLPAGSSVIITIWVTVPLTATPDTVDITTLVATSHQDPVATAQVIDTTTVSAPLQVGGAIWHDRNNNGLVDSGEPGMANVLVQLFHDGDDPGQATPVLTTTSDAQGNYRFTGLAVGRYFLYMPTPPHGYPVSSVSTDPADNGEDQDDNGEQATDGGPIVSPIVALTIGGEPMIDGDDANSDQTLDFGFLALASVGDLVWYDSNHDGIQGANELSMPNVARNVGAPGIVVTLHDADDQRVLATTTTNSEGRYRFRELLPGSYYLHFDLPAAYQLTTQYAAGPVVQRLGTQPSADETSNAFDSDVNPVTMSTATFVLTSGERKSTVDMGVYLRESSQPVTLGDWVWYDANGNGRQDGDESGIAGITLTLRRADGSPVLTTKSEADGHYLFTGLPLGTYYLAVTPPTGYSFSLADQGGEAGDATDSDVDPATGQTAAVNLSSGQRLLTQDIGLTSTTPPANLKGLAWLDLDQDGIRDGEERIIIGVTVELYAADGALIASATTGADGQYTFRNLMPNDYYIVFTAPAGYLSSPAHQGADDTVDSDALSNLDGLTAQTPLITLQPGNNDSARDYGLRLAQAPAQIGELVWFDSNGNGMRDDNEAGLAGVVVKLYNDAGELRGVTETDSNGHYLFDNLVPGIYFVEFVIPDGYIFSPLSTVTDGDDDSNAEPTTGRTAPILVLAGDLALNYDAGMVQHPTDLDNGGEPGELVHKIFLPICMKP